MHVYTCMCGANQRPQQTESYYPNQHVVGIFVYSSMELCTQMTATIRGPGFYLKSRVLYLAENDLQITFYQLFCSWYTPEHGFLQISVHYLLYMLQIAEK